MSVRLQETTFAAGTEGVLAALSRDGAVIVHDMIAPDALEQFRADMERVAQERQLGTVVSQAPLREFWGESTMRFTRLGARSEAFLEILDHPGFRGVADELLLPYCKSYWLNTAQMIILAPGQSEQELHRDSENWWHITSPAGPELTVSCMFAIGEFTEENGATRVVPGSHRWDDYERAVGDGDEVIQAAMPAGSGMLYTGKVIHGGGANRTTDVWRWGLHISFVLGWLAPEEASPLGVPWELVRNRSEHIQRLLGWRCTSFANGGGRLWTIDYEDVPVGLELVEDARRPDDS